MTVTTTRLIELSITSDPDSSLFGTVWSFTGGDLVSTVDASMDADVVSTPDVMQPGDTIDLDGNGTFEGTYVGRFNYQESTYTLGDGSTVTGPINIIEVTVDGTSQYYMIISDFLAPYLDGADLSSVTFSSNFTTSSNTAGLNFDDAVTYELVCFAQGTRIAAEHGERPVEDLKVGECIRTTTNGWQKIRWIGRRRFTGAELKKNAKLRPVRIIAGALGNGLPKRDLLVSRQHRLLVSSKIAYRMFGETDILIPAIKMTDLPGIFVDEEVEDVVYFHLLFDRHEVIFANGTPSESLFTGPEALKAVGHKARQEIIAIFPELNNTGNILKPARLVVSGKKQKQFIARHAKNQRPLLESFPW